MAVLGRCITCDKLVPIRRQGYRASGLPKWIPLEHDDGEKRCTGAGKDVG